MSEPTIECISFVIPALNEKGTLEELTEGIRQHTQGLAPAYEIIYVDDGSDDGTVELMEELAERYPEVRAVILAFNHGKAAALSEGIEAARGDVIITMDADLQDDPVEIPRFIEKLKEGFDLVSGWKEDRKDPWHKTVPSKLFNAVVRKSSGLQLHDFNCGFKAYRSRILKQVKLYGELHRYIPVLAQHYGARITEIPVHHNPRRYGVSKYGWERLVKGFLDLVTVMVTTRYLKRPLHLFGSVGLVCMILGGLVMTYMAILWLCGGGPIGNRPLLFYGMLSTILGVQIFSLGVMSELFLRFNTRSEKPIVRSRVGFGE